MFCPQCGSQQNDELKFCKVCGANLFAVRQAVAMREPEEKFDWSKTWVAEMFMSGQERQRHEEELERQRGITPEVKRYNEIKAGVITAFVGIAVTIFLNVLMQGIILSGKPSPGEAEILSRIWVAGIIPFFVGIAIIINGMILGKKIVEVTNKKSSSHPESLPPGTEQPRTLRPADTSEFLPPNFGVTEDTTKHLYSYARKQPAATANEE